MSDFLIVDSEILPEIYTKVIETKNLISSGKASNASEAVKMTGISRSAFYKYKDHVSVYNDAADKIVTFQGVLSDRPGVLSSFISQLYNFGANILTVNQDLPINGKASVSITVSCENVEDGIDLFEEVKTIDGVLSLRQVRG